MTSIPTANGIGKWNPNSSSMLENRPAQSQPIQASSRNNKAPTIRALDHEAKAFIMESVQSANQWHSSVKLNMDKHSSHIHSNKHDLEKYDLGKHAKDKHDLGKHDMDKHDLDKHSSYSLLHKHDLKRSMIQTSMI